MTTIHANALDYRMTQLNHLAQQIDQATLRVNVSSSRFGDAMNALVRNTNTPDNWDRYDQNGCALDDAEAYVNDRISDLNELKELLAEYAKLAEMDPHEIESDYKHYLSSLVEVEDEL